MSLYRCFFRRDRVHFARDFVGHNIDEVENQAAIYAHHHGAAYLGAEFQHSVEGVA